MSDTQEISTKGPFTVAGDIARLIEKHPGETARGLYRLHMERFAEFGTDNTYAAAMVQQQLVKLEDQGLVRREKGANKTAPHKWFWVGGEDAPAGAAEEGVMPQEGAAEEGVMPQEGAADTPRLDVLQKLLGAAVLARLAAAPHHRAAAEDDAPPGVGGCQDDAEREDAARLADVPIWQRPDFEIKADMRNVAHVEAAAEPTCRAELTFTVGGTEMSFHHEGGWDKCVAARLERFLLAAAEGK